MESGEKAAGSSLERQLLGRFTVPETDVNFRKGSYWSIRGNAADYPAQSSLPCPASETEKLASVPTGLAAPPDKFQERLINWGYAICDAAMRTHVDPALQPPTKFPYPIGL